MDWKTIANGAVLAAILWGFLFPVLSIPSLAVRVLLGILIALVPGLFVGLFAKSRWFMTGWTAAFFGAVLGIPAMFIGAVFTDVEKAGYTLRVLVPLSFLVTPLVGLCSQLVGRMRQSGVVRGEIAGVAVESSSETKTR